ncbi:MAG: ribosomal protein large subunit ribosomal protein [Candidatus Taylorbacteria bacterium]|nr:ribosomal protein large subunit ribosomal protein [Candidatus Taylorbacteria bacterium]
MITASLKNFRQSPRKVRLVANLIRGKSVVDALNILKFVSKKATDPLYGLVMSAVANAKNDFNLEKEGLIVKEIRVDVGVVLKRSMPRARGSAFPIKKRTSHVLLVLAPAPEKKAKKVKFIKPVAANATK